MHIHFHFFNNLIPFLCTSTIRFLFLTLFSFRSKAYQVSTMFMSSYFVFTLFFRLILTPTFLSLHSKILPITRFHVATCYMFSPSTYFLNHAKKGSFFSCTSTTYWLQLFLTPSSLHVGFMHQHTVSRINLHTSPLF